MTQLNPVVILRYLVFSVVIILLIAPLNKLRGEETFTYKEINGIRVQKGKFHFDVKFEIELSSPSGTQLFGSRGYKITIKHFDSKLVKYTYNGADYSLKEDDRLRTAFDKVTIDRISVNCDISGLSDCEHIFIALGKVGSSNTNFCNPQINENQIIQSVDLYDFSYLGSGTIDSDIRALITSSQGGSQWENDGGAIESRIDNRNQALSVDKIESQSKETSEDSNAQNESRYYYERFNQMKQAGNNEAAMNAINVAISLDPNNASYKTSKSQLNADMIMKENQQAREDFTKTAQQSVAAGASATMELLNEKGGRFGIYKGFRTTGLSWGSNDVFHMNLGVDLKKFSSFQSGFELEMKFLTLKNPHDPRIRMGLRPAFGIIAVMQETDDFGDPIEETDDFTAITGGLAGYLEQNGFYIKMGYLKYLSYIDYTNKPADESDFYVGLGFGFK